jgi:hypothetical protein
MKKKSFLMIWVISLLILASLACSWLDKINQVQQNVQSVATQFQGVTTQVPGLIDTARAIVTANPGLIKTGQALITEKGPGLVKTIRAFATENPSLAKTAIAMATQATQSGNSGSAVSDIPLPPQDRLEQYNSTPSMVVFFTNIKYSKVVNFYKTEMVNNSWKAVEQGTTKTTNSTTLKFSKDNRTSSVMITYNPDDNMTGVVITIQTK